MSKDVIELNAKAPSLKPPIMEVGFNYAWAFDRYGTWIGPDGPIGHSGSATPTWRDTAKDPPAGTLARNLKILRDDLNIKKVRMFILGNAWNYGAYPTLTGRLKVYKSDFTAPASPDPLFLSHFRHLLEVFRDAEMQVLPSLIDFGAFYPRSNGPGDGGGGRTSVLTTQRKTFLDTMLKPMLAESKKFAGIVYAWEAVNEPIWPTNSVFRPHTPTTTADTDKATMADFLKDCLKMIEGEGFPSTVGHRYLSDLDKFPTGTLPQFHYYGDTRPLTDDPNPIPTFASLSGSARNAFVGEISPCPEDPGYLWPECKAKQDDIPSDAAYVRLRLLAFKGYKLVFIWPDIKDPGNDGLKLSANARMSIRSFTKDKFPNGVPDTPFKPIFL